MRNSRDKYDRAVGTSEAGANLKEAEKLDRSGHWDEAISIYDRALKEAREEGDEWSEAHVLRKVGEIKRKRGDAVSALRMFRSSQNLFRKLGDRKSLSYLYNNIGLVYFVRGKWKLVKRYFGRALKIARAEGEKKLEGQIFNNLGIMSQIRGQEKKAVVYFERALPCYEAVDFGKGIAQTYNNIGMCYRDRRRWREAKRYYEISYEKSCELNDLNLMGITSLNIAMVNTRLDELKVAKVYCEKAYSIFEKLDDKLGIAESDICFGVIHRQKHEHRRSEIHFKKSIELNGEIDNHLGLAEAYRELALLYQDMGKSSLVLQYLGDSFKVFRELQASRYVDDIDEKIQELERIYIEITRKMGEEVESRDTYTFGHCQRVAHYSAILASEVGLPVQERKAILVAAYLHDLGKVKIPPEILKKPKKLTPDEYLTIMKHPAWGVEMLESIEFPWDVKPLIMHHQERFDGKGYPDGLEGEKIPLCARIISIADFFDAMTTDRPYRKALNIDETLSIMNREKGKTLDPELLEIFEPLIRKRFPMTKSPKGEFEFGEMEETLNDMSNDISPVDEGTRTTGQGGKFAIL